MDPAAAAPNMGVRRFGHEPQVFGSSCVSATSLRVASARRRTRLIAGGSALVTAAFVASVALPAHGVEPTHSGVVSMDPNNVTPNVNQGKVESMVQVGSRMIAVGKFTSVTAPASAGGATFTRNSIFAFNATTGAIDTAFIPNVGTAEVTEVVDAGDGTVYIGGLFSKVNGVAKTAKVAQINATTGAVVTAFKAPALNGGLSDIQLINGRLYISGAFTTVGGQPHTLLTALNPTTGADTNTLNVSFTDTWNGGALGIKHFDISDSGSTLVAVGNFKTINGESRPQIVKLNLTGPTATLSPWATQRYTTNCASVFDTYLRDIDIAPSGNYMAVVATGAQAGGVGSGTLCDTASRWELGPTNESAGQDPSWVNYSGGDTFTQVKITGPIVYVGGHFRWMNNPFNADSAGQGAVPRDGLAALDPRTGLPTSWNPGRDRGVGVWEFLPTTTGLWVGHDTNHTGGEIRKRIAFFPLTRGFAMPAENTGSLPGDVYLLGQPAGDTVIDRDYDGTTASDTTAATGGVQWSSTRGAVMIDNTLYTGWSDGTLKARTYNGTTFGAATNVNLYGLTNFANEIPNITGMFYDKSAGRLYYSLPGQSQLFYRYFEPQSSIVGAVRFNGPATSSGIDFGSVSGMFLDNGNLYVGSSATGHLNVVHWSNGVISGSAADVSAGKDWRAKGMFLYAS